MGQVRLHKRWRTIGMMTPSTAAKLLALVRQNACNDIRDDQDWPMCQLILDAQVCRPLYDFQF